MKNLSNVNVNVNLRSAETEEFISRRPSFAVRWGNSILFSLLIAVLALSWFIEYPEIISAKGKVNSVNGPKEVVARASGKLLNIFVSEGEFVEKGAVIGYIESLANHDSEEQLRAFVDSLNSLVVSDKIEEVNKFYPDYSRQKHLSELGELQSSFEEFLKTFTFFKDYLSNGIYEKKKTLLKSDLLKITELHSLLEEQMKYMRQDLNLSDENFTVSKSLVEDKVISPLDFRNETSKLLLKKMSLPQIKMAIVNNEVQFNAKIKEISELENQILVEKNNFIQALQTLRSSLAAWEYKYRLTATLAGSVSFSGFLEEGQEVKDGQKLFVISPRNSIYYFEMLIPQYDFGSVDVGQKVLLKFEAYPFERFGMSTGQITMISKISSDSGFLAKVSLNDSAQARVVLPGFQLKDGLVAKAEIVTKDVKLIHRLFYFLRGKASR